MSMQGDALSRLGGLRPLTSPSRAERPSTAERAASPSTDFRELLRQSIERLPELHLSKHVQDRLQQRQLHVDEAEWRKVQQAVQTAATKGIRDSLVITREAAFIVNVPNRTVVTAMERQALQQRVFTNIDGAVIVD